MITIIVLIITVLAVLFTAAAIMFFALRAPTAGAVFGVLALFLALADLKAFQIRKMTSTPMMMPATTVSSATVKEEDWAPTLSAVGSVSAVQGAIIAAELGGVISDIKFENGGVAKKGDGIMKLDASQEEALLRSAE